ncbi:hypothetical protein H5410_054051, partial [Solanum commersonii]
RFYRVQAQFSLSLSSTETLDLVRRRRPKNAVDPDSDLLKPELFTIWVLLNFEVLIFESVLLLLGWQPQKHLLLGNSHRKP